MTTNWIDVHIWCDGYNSTNKYPTNTLERYAVAIYQIHQGMEWEDSLNKAESYMSCFLHLEMVCVELGFSPLLKTDLTSYKTCPLHYKYERILYLISKIQQQLFYLSRMKRTQRGSRYNRNLTCGLLKELQLIIIGCVPSHQRLGGMNDAINIMTGKL